MFLLQVFQLQLQLTLNRFDLFPLMVISITVNVNLNHTVSGVLLGIIIVGGMMINISNGCHIKAGPASDFTELCTVLLNRPVSTKSAKLLYANIFVTGPKE